MLIPIYEETAERCLIQNFFNESRKSLFWIEVTLSCYCNAVLLLQIWIELTLNVDISSLVIMGSVCNIKDDLYLIKLIFHLYVFWLLWQAHPIYRFQFLILIHECSLFELGRLLIARVYFNFTEKCWLILEPLLSFLLCSWLLKLEVYFSLLKRTWHDIKVYSTVSYCRKTRATGNYNYGKHKSTSYILIPTLSSFFSSSYRLVEPCEISFASSI